MQSYKEIKTMAVEVRELYDLKKIPLHPTCELAVIINAAVVLADEWESQGIFIPDNSNAAVIKASNTYRIAQAILSIKSEPNITLHLKRLTTGDLKATASGISEAKNFLWEVDVFHILKTSGLSPIFVEPPDIQVSINGTTLSIACKKIYSEENFNKPLSTAVKQIKRSKCHGIVAINIDEAIQSTAGFSWSAQKAVSDWLVNENVNFYQRHGTKLKEYLTTQRVLGYLVSSSITADVQTNSPRLTNVSQGSFWNLPDIPAEPKALIKAFYGALQTKEVI
jgi:hypothetical protein